MQKVLALDANGQMAEVEVRGGGVAAVPTLIADADTFTVPANSQALFAEEITVDGELDIDGILVEVV